jgi:hypothetical protein
MTDDKLDDRYASFREHASLSSEVRERLVALETGLRTDVSEIKAMLVRAPFAPAPVPHQELQGLSLAIQRMMDAFDRRASGTDGGTSQIVRALAVVGAVSLGAVGMWFFLHH